MANKETSSLDSAASAVGHLYEAKERLGDAANAGVDAVKNGARAAVNAATAAGRAAARAAAKEQKHIQQPLRDVKQALGAAAKDAKSAGSQEFQRLGNKSRQGWQAVRTFVTEHPAAAVATAAVVGLLAGACARKGRTP